jgi:hypothetical protein
MWLRSAEKAWKHQRTPIRSCNDTRMARPGPECDGTLNQALVVTELLYRACWLMQVCRGFLVRAIQVRVNFAITQRQYNYLVWWYSRSRYRRRITKLSRRIFELRPNALSFYAIARLDEGLKRAPLDRLGRLTTYLTWYPVGSDTDIPPLPRMVTRLFSRRKLGKRQYAFLRDMKLLPNPGPWGEWPKLPRKKRRMRSARVHARRLSMK